MLNIGIDDNFGLLYEGTGSYYGRAVWPMPFITPARIVLGDDGPFAGEGSSVHEAKGLRFREDFFDPIARIRRGRFYDAAGAGAQPAEWHVQPHPAMPFDNTPTDSSGIVKRLYTFYGNPFWETYLKDAQEPPLVLLGQGDKFTVWTVIDVETITTGEDLVTLKARRSLGMLPIVDYGGVPQPFRDPLRESLDALVDDARRSGPVSVVDRARDAASQILIAHYDGKAVKDVAKLATKLENDGHIVAASVCKIVARLHARAKPTERVKRPLRPVREQDAELAVQCVGTLLCELGIAEWG